MRAAGVLLLLSLAACTNGIQPRAYPLGFEYMSRNKIRGDMWSIAAIVQRLDHRLRTTTASVDRENVIADLRALEAAIVELEPSGRSVNHPILDHNLPAFSSAVRAAREAAEHDPPNYYLAGAVAGGCSNCHY